MFNDINVLSEERSHRGPERTRKDLQGPERTRKEPKRSERIRKDPKGPERTRKDPKGPESTRKLTRKKLRIALGRRKNGVVRQAGFAYLLAFCKQPIWVPLHWPE